MDRRRTHWVSLLLTLLLVGVRDVAAGSLTLHWDPSPDSGVSGYVVYVGTRAGAYTANINVGSQTSFVFENAVPGQEYFFAVAAYAPGTVIGPLSAEVSGRLAPAPTTLAPSSTGVPDTTPPVLRLTQPTSNAKYKYEAPEPLLLIGGTASDNDGVAAIYWTNKSGTSGKATGTDAWIAGIPLKQGANEIVVTAIDRNSNSSTATLSIVYRLIRKPPAGALDRPNSPRPRPVID